MKDIRTLFRDAISRLKERGHKTLYVAVDAHGTIIRPSKKTVVEMSRFGVPHEVTHSFGTDSEMSFYPDAREALIKMAESGVRLILWTSTRDPRGLVMELLKSGLSFYYLNFNPEFQSTPYADFSKKFYFDVLLDDKAGFEPEKDWKKILEIDFGKELKQEDMPGERERQ